MPDSAYVYGVFYQKVLRGDMAFVSGRSAGAREHGWHSIHPPLPPPPSFVLTKKNSNQSPIKFDTHKYPNITHNNIVSPKVYRCSLYTQNRCGHKNFLFLVIPPDYFSILHQMEVELANFPPEDIKALRV